MYITKQIGINNVGWERSEKPPSLRELGPKNDKQGLETENQDWGWERKFESEGKSMGSWGMRQEIRSLYLDRGLQKFGDWGKGLGF